MAIAANILIGLVAILHIWFFVLERFIWNMPLGQKIFRMSAEKAAAGSLLAANQGVYNLILALGLIWTILAQDSQQANPVKFALLGMIILVGIYGGLTVGRNIFFMQVIPAVAALLAVVIACSVPKINDVTTSFEQPPQFKEHAAAQPDQDFKYPQEFSAEQKLYYESVMPLTIPFDSQQAFAFMDKALLSFPDWQILRKDSLGFIVEGSEKSQFMGFTDDFVIEVRPAGGSSEIHMRSRSRVGKSDFGVNAQRINKFLNRVHSISRSGH